VERIYRVVINERTGGRVRDLGLGLKNLAAMARLQEKNLIAKDSLARQEVKKYTDAEFVCDSHYISAFESDRP
jgi:hypothetical protein